MNPLPIGSITQAATSTYGLESRAKRQEGEAAAAQDSLARQSGQAPAQEQGDTAGQAAKLASMAAELQASRLNTRQARSLVQTTADDIAGTHPAKLDEIQEVLERSLVPAKYV